MNHPINPFHNGLRLLLCDSETLVRQGLRCLLEAKGFRVVAEVADGRGCLASTCQTRPDVAVIDAQSCTHATLIELQKVCPTMKIVVLTKGDGVNQASVLERLGCASVTKNDDAATLSSVIKKIVGEAEPAPCLPMRDWELLRLVATGWTNKEIGSALGLAEKTVRCRLTDIFSTLGVRNRTEAALYALGQGTAEP